MMQIATPVVAFLNAQCTLPHTATVSVGILQSGARMLVVHFVRKLPLGIRPSVETNTKAGCGAAGTLAIFAAE